MSEQRKNDQEKDAYLESLKNQGAELLANAPAEGTIEHARLSLIDAKIEQLTSPITAGAWKPPKD
ncbi:hypothetical protein M2375_004239 [Comamonas sp. BIGb0152]|uniref:hypothetical protein n=1 Tax=Comamonas sp. BIGb0152 TaxID=2940601 RepID=UPI00216AAD31|nr:hypothetical protein [Comamonas sp. BIGb0152]MCS4295989.1 hypothetical protein [Comamonas sp. BIGb0152]